MKLRQLFFKHTGGYHHAAILLAQNKCIQVYNGVDGSCSIEIMTGEYPTQLRHESFLSSKWKKCKASEFVDAINCAHEAMLNTPYL